jgi:hypothetical protein
LIARPFPGIITEEEIISMTEMQSNQQSKFHDPCKTPLSREITKFQETQNSVNKVLDNHKAQPSSQSHSLFFSLPFQIMVSRLLFRSSK